jgi:hypothetical protein
MPWSSAARAGQGGRVRALGWAGLRERARREARGPVRKEKPFSLYFSINNPKSLILSIKNSFSKVDPKTKVVQYLILYNIA